MQAPFFINHHIIVAIAFVAMARGSGSLYSVHFGTREEEREMERETELILAVLLEFQVSPISLIPVRL